MAIKIKKFDRFLMTIIPLFNEYNVLKDRKTKSSAKPN